MKTKKILIFSLIILILAGMVIVALKGFNVDLMLQKHDSIEYIIGKDFEIKDIKQITKEIFLKKKVVIRTIEVFDDAVSINVSSITEEEKNNLIEKLDEKYKNGEQTEDVQIISNPPIRIRELVNPYIIPTIIAFGLIYILEEVKLYKNIKKSYLRILESIIRVIVLELSLLSLIAICRIPVSILTIPLLLVIAMIEIILYFNKEMKNI